LDSSHRKSAETLLFCLRFIEAYPERIVNSLYYDDNKFSLYDSAQQGISERKKIRIRFYDNGSSGLAIENKIREGEVNWKTSQTIEEDEKNLLTLELKNKGKKNNTIIIPKTINGYYSPKLLVSYNRKYFVFPEKDYRVTLDTQIKFYKINLMNKTVELTSERILEHDIIEVKYDYDINIDNIFINALTSQFNLILSKSSKYCKGIAKHYYI
tara:strand:- start:4370 stop:5005 length:636 start_codon:yes stop_codon:yes gene_type:complete